jgi:hypothetical protein
MTQYGNDTEPGIVSDLTSSASVPSGGDAPNNIGIVGQADLVNATDPADTTTVYEVSRASNAFNWFGPAETSLLTSAIIDALDEGAGSVYAVVAPETEVTSEDQSGISGTKVDLDYSPIREDPARITVDLDGTMLDTSVVYDGVDSYSPSAGAAVANPVRGTLEVPSTPSTTLDVGYEYFDYQSGIDVMLDLVPDEIDQLYPLSEASSVVDYAQQEVNALTNEYELVTCAGGAEIHIPDFSAYTNPYDDSRTQLVYPTRFEDGTSAIGAYAGMRATLGLSETPINKRLQTNKRLNVGVKRADRGTLTDANVVPLADESRGVRVTDDPTTVTSSNTDEMNLEYGFNRLAADYIIETTRENEQPFIGDLNSQTVRNVLEGLVSGSLTDLQESSVVLSYNIEIQKVSATRARLEMYVDLIEPLRFIENTITIGSGE